LFTGWSSEADSRFSVKNGRAAKPAFDPNQNPRMSYSFAVALVDAESSVPASAYR
jgi:hypothetical protein